ncbi:hypothetical protein CONLIGDRAFT_224823 [Coniochaeta ligniaria NRRL 30616]|uniref:Uncharacterized protein n=1 Tax=Coniochaeta ligniaria NRRL 30616 TaxID=1408157 RepID=A0A1J7I4F7_9PEZI|nr:hypothetical protein CONLIGDRAFT_224823 [Coniochaeta ligniaria NRRL 30616]
MASKQKRGIAPNSATMSNISVPDPNDSHEPDLSASHATQSIVAAPTTTAADSAVNSSPLLPDITSATSSPTTAPSSAQASDAASRPGAFITNQNTTTTTGDTTTTTGHPVTTTVRHPDAADPLAASTHRIMTLLTNLYSSLNLTPPTNPDVPRWHTLFTALHSHVPLLSVLDPALTTFNYYSTIRPTRSRLSLSLNHNPATATLQQSFDAMERYIDTMGEVPVDWGYDPVPPAEWYRERHVPELLERLRGVEGRWVDAHVVAEEMLAVLEGRGGEGGEDGDG